MRTNVANYLQLACRLSTNVITEKLIKKGALLSVASGEQNVTPFMAAVEKTRRDTVTLLLTKYNDQFDPFARDKNNHYALLRIIHKPQHASMMKFLTESLLQYRTTKFRESKMVALGKIFHYEPEMDKYITFWNFAKPVPVKKVCESFINEHGIDLTAQLPETTTLDALISNGIALSYCFEQIGKHLNLLRLQGKYSKLNILHTLIRGKHLTFVKELYDKHEPLMVEIFEVKDSEGAPAFELLRLLLHNAYEEGIIFVLEHHREFYMTDKQKLLKAVMQYNLSKISYEKFYLVFLKTVPELREEVDIAKCSNTPPDDIFYNDLRGLRERFTGTVSRLEANGKQLDDYLGCDRRTFLHVAVTWRDKSLVEKLLDHGMDVMKLDNEGRLPIHLVDRFESLFELLLSKNESAQLSYVNPAGHNLLHISCKNGLRGSALEKLLAHGMDVNGPTPDGQLPLSLASCCGTVTFLLEHGARLELLNGDLLERSLNHMHYCAAMVLIPQLAHLPWFRECAHIYLPWFVGHHNRDFFSGNQSFLEQHPDSRRLLFDCLCEKRKELAAELFARVCHNSIVCCVQWFLERDYDIDYNHRFWSDSTPLIGLLTYFEMDVEGQLEAAQKLLQKPRVDVNAVAERGYNALMALAKHHRWMKRYELMVLRMVATLVERGIEIDAQDEAGNTALHYAFEDERWELIESLIEHGASVAIQRCAVSVNEDCGRHSRKCSSRNRITGSHRKPAKLQPSRASNMSSIVRKVITTKKIPKAVAAYSQAIVADRTVYCSGLLGLDVDTLKLVPGGAGPQAAKALEHLTNLLAEAGSGIDKVVKATVLLGDMNDYAVVNDEYKKVFSSSFPARTCFGGVKLPLGAAVEIEVIALTGAVVNISE
uniref:Uncharacterized protein n=1 Tax=Anopheles farauti TaxID=69004 RepID=A0A182QFA6_9DIPT